MYRLLLVVEQDIEDALLYTAREYGVRKYEDYAALVEEALEVLSVEPAKGTKRPDIHPEAWIYKIAKPGRRARHLFLYRLGQDQIAVIYGLLYDGMSLPKQWRQRDLETGRS